MAIRPLGPSPRSMASTVANKTSGVCVCVCGVAPCSNPCLHGMRSRMLAPNCVARTAHGRPTVSWYGGSHLRLHGSRRGCYFYPTNVCGHDVPHVSSIARYVVACDRHAVVETLHGWLQARARPILQYGSRRCYGGRTPCCEAYSDSVTPPHTLPSGQVLSVLVLDAPPLALHSCNGVVCG